MKRPKYVICGWNPVSNAGYGPHMKAKVAPTVKDAYNIMRKEFGSCEDVHIYKIGEMRV
jgi:hypothetical protein